MNLSKTKIGIFFLAVFLLAWFLYPRELFLGYIYEGQSRLEEAEKYYLRYLSRRPYNKSATFRLADLYDRIGEPARATAILKSLYDHRWKDWSLAERYLSHLEDVHDEEALYQARIEVAHHFQKDRLFPKARIEELLSSAYQYARWKQRSPEAYQLLDELIALGRDRSSYREEKVFLDFGNQRTTEVIKTLNEKLRLNPAQKDIREELVGIYEVLGHFDKALEIAEEGLRFDPNPKTWWPLKAVLYQKLGRLEEAAALLEDYLKLFPEDFEKQKMLVQLYLYDRKDVSKVSFYRDYLLRSYHTDEGISYTENFAVDVGRLLFEKKQKQEASLWLQQISRLFPNRFEIIEMQMDLFNTQQDYFASQKLGEAFLKSHPDDSRMMLKVALIYAEQGDIEKAREWFYRALKFRKDDPKIYFLLSELDFSQGEKTRGVAGAKHVLDFLPEDEYKDFELNRIRLKSRGRIYFDQEVDSDYRLALFRNPLSLDLHMDYFDLLVENKKYFQAETELDEIKKKFPDQVPVHRTFEVRLAFAEGHWKKAVSLLKELVLEKPNAWGYHRDLAEAHRRSGDWREALREYEAVRQATGNQLEVEQPLRELHQNYDARVGTRFHFEKLGSDEVMAWTLFYRQFLASRLEFESDISVGRFRSPSFGTSGFLGEAIYGNFSMTQNISDFWKIQAGVGYGVSDRRKTLSPFVAVDIQPLDVLHAHIGYNYRQLRVDIPQTVGGGVLEDTTKVQLDYTPVEWLVLAGHYHFDRNYLPEGGLAYENTLEPTLAFVLLKKPRLTLGYQFTLSQVFDKNDFLKTIPLVPKVRAHYLTSSASFSVGRFDWELGFFAGEDTARNLHLFQGDLFGLRSLIEWNILEWFDLQASYEFGRQTLTTVTGQSHQVVIGVSGHW